MATQAAVKKWIVPPGATPAELQEILKPAAQLLAAGEVVAFPTETVYGLGGNALSDSAAQKIFAAKGRPSDNPLIVHVCDRKMIDMVSSKLTPSAEKLVERFWPGPLTVLVPCNDKVSRFCTAGQPNVGLRMPDHPVARALIELSGVPIAAPSANKSGKPSPTTAEHVLSDFGNSIPGVVDGGACQVGLESTVVDCTDPDPNVITILRPGGVSREQLQSVIPTVHVDPTLESGIVHSAPKAPGMKYTHYAPAAPVRIVRGSPEFFVQVIRKLQTQQHQKVGVLCSSELADTYKCADHIETCGSRADLQTVARGLFAGLRKFDSTDVAVILAEPFDTLHIGHAIMNRLSKSAGHVQITSLDDV